MRQLFRWLAQLQAQLGETAAGALFFCAAALPSNARQLHASTATQTE